MNKLTALCAIGALSACQASNLPIVNKLAKPKAKAETLADTGPMRPTGAAFEAAATSKVTSFESCVGVGIIVPGSSPIQCVHEGVTFTSG